MMGYTHPDARPIHRVTEGTVLQRDSVTVIYIHTLSLYLLTYLLTYLLQKKIEHTSHIYRPSEYSSDPYIYKS